LFSFVKPYADLVGSQEMKRELIPSRGEVLCFVESVVRGVVSAFLPFLGVKKAVTCPMT
jgi:hypothetical protein